MDLRKYKINVWKPLHELMSLEAVPDIFVNLDPTKFTKYGITEAITQQGAPRGAGCESDEDITDYCADVTVELDWDKWGPFLTNLRANPVYVCDDEEYLFRGIVRMHELSLVPDLYWVG